MNTIFDKLNEFKQETSYQYMIQGLGVVAVFYFVNNVLIKNFKKNSIIKKYERRGKQQKQKRDNYLKNLKILDPQLSQDLQNTILEAPISQLRDMLNKNIITSVQLLNFYASRAYPIGMKLNLIAESNYEEALQQAQKCDQLRKTNPDQCKGELFGLVMTIKDSFFQKGYSNTVGLVNNLDKIEEKDGLAVKILKESGAIIFARANVPQMILAFETDNEIYGQAKNPWNHTKSTGGSSGGSAGLVSSRSTPFCFGSDIGGSIRVPSLFNGTTGFKPCSYRVSAKGHTTVCHTSSGQLAVRGAVGPITKYVDDSVEIMKACLNENTHNNLSDSERDTFFTLRPWNDQIYKSQKKLKIGYYKSISFFPPTQPVQDAVQQTVDILKNQGHQLVEINPPCTDEVIATFFQIVGSVGRKTLDESLKGEKPSNLYQGFLFAIGLSSCTRKFMAFLLGLFGQKRASDGLSKMGEKSAYDLMKSNADLQVLRQTWIDYFTNQKLDAVVCPGYGMVAGQHGFSNDLMFPFLYSGLYSTLDFPAGVVPVGVVQDDTLQYKDSFNDLVTKLANDAQKNTKGLPVGVQVVSLPFKEEICLNIMKQIETQVNFHKQYKPNLDVKYYQ